MADLDETELLARASAAAGRSWPGAEVVGLRRLEGGVSSLTFASTLRIPGEPERPTVLKVAPPGVAPVRNRDVLRQSRLLRRLGPGEGIRVPAIWFEDDGSPPLFGMELAPGECWEPKTNHIDDPPAPGVVAERARAAARMLAAMQNLSLESIGLADEPALSVADEVGRWARLLSTVDPDIAPGHEDVFGRLMAALPDPVPPALLHGDYRLGNMLFDGDRLSAVIDWEIWSVGDPRTDLAWLLMHTDPAHRFVETADAANVRAAAGMPTREELLAEYQAGHPGEFADLDWFLAYCFYKVAATVSVFVKRNRRLAEPDPVMVTVGATLPDVIARAARVLDAAGP